MNPNADVLFKLIVPAIFLLIWAVSQVFTKEAPPTPRSVPPGGGGGGFPPRPGGPGAGRTGPFSWSEDRAQIPERDIIILNTETRAPRTPMPGRPRPSARRPRPAASEAPRPEPPPTRSRLLGELPGAGAATAVTAPPATVDRPAGPSVTPAVAALQKALNNPERLRETFLLIEILQPPLALRRPEARRV